ncbi:prepilin-type N-terminal cleavage/methylation domain-containing protein [Geotalea uraniireducens]|uniref:Prepilin-type N-terminal cleavage/methylation domain-containing protein n=1 Tax=Geotalea uraniireducens (strain Rf4) TaxID=351605 RepID=A5GEZ2_GEOUR|nr:prepilin-type N-terminal cleavage/methylation domain-containing protein [Geotalea uraniireducens]ABQ25997.1 hypothetical protein Gura_1807 [Geotalea uraniireducens Rf4]
MSDKKGFTLIELVVTMAIFVIVIMLSSFVFEKVIGQASQRSKTIEGQLEGVVGLEILRTDLDSAGYGLPFKIMSSATKISGYTEAVDSPNFPVPGVDRASLNDAPATSPRGVVSVNGSGSVGFNQSDYLVIKSVTVALNDTSKKSSRVTYNKIGTDPFGKIAVTGTDDLQPDERAIVMRSTFEGGIEKKRELLIDEKNGGTFFVTVPSTFLPTAFSPLTTDDTCLIYGIDPANGSPLRMPFNRADYFVKRPANVPKICNAGTGVLYKATTNHNNGGITYYPLVDCIGDMQVIYLLDMDEDSAAGTYSNADGSQISPLGDPEKVDGVNVSISDVVATLHDPELLRLRLKEIQVYVLAQMGKRDNVLNYPNDDIVVGKPEAVGRKWSASDMAGTFGAEWRNYRWKVYKITSNASNMQ